MARKASIKEYIFATCVVVAGLLVTSMYVLGCIQQERGRFQQNRDQRDQVKGQVQPVPHERNK